MWLVLIVLDLLEFAQEWKGIDSAWSLSRAEGARCYGFITD